MFRSKKKKQRAELLANYHNVKRGSFNFGSIERYFVRSDNKGIYQVISDKTYQDLDLNEVFMFIDRTVSTVGQQYYYHIFRTLPQDKKRCDRFERLIQLFKGNTALKESVLLQLSRLSRYEAYRITSLIHEDYIQPPTWFWIIRPLALVSIASVLLSFFYPQLLILLILILATNYIIHFWNKANLFQYAETIPQLLVLNQVAKAILKHEAFSEREHEVTISIKSMDSIGHRLSIFKWEPALQSDIGAIVDYLVEVIKALFLVEPLLLFNALKEFDLRREQLHKIYQFVGELDVALSIASLREGLSYYSQPTIIEKKKQLSGIDVYHPLLENYVSNSIELHQKSALLTGSNMSGKSTFIRTMGINVLMGQSINTCFARAFAMPRLKIHSAIRIADDMMSEKSYYFEEVLTIKKILEESRSNVQNLFLLDELFKGTNMVERVAIGKSVLTYLNEDDNIVLIATHDIELSEYLSSTYNLYHFTEVVESETIAFDYKIKAGNLKTTNAIKILELNDYPDEVLLEATQLSKQINIRNRV